MSAKNIPSARRIANIALNDAMILPYDANPDRMEFSERTGRTSMQMFMQDPPPVLKRHVVTGERHHASAKLDMQTMQRRLT
jgi:hypothetical protein